MRASHPGNPEVGLLTASRSGTRLARAARTAATEPPNRWIASVATIMKRTSASQRDISPSDRDRVAPVLSNGGSRRELHRPAQPATHRGHGIEDVVLPNPPGATVTLARELVDRPLNVARGQGEQRTLLELLSRQRHCRGVLVPVEVG